MRVRIIDKNMADEMAAQLGRQVLVGSSFEAVENTVNWMDEDARPFAYEVILEQTSRTTFGMWVHKEEVEVLTPKEELSAHGFPGYSDKFAEQVLLYMTENDCPAQVAITVITGHDALLDFDTKEEGV